MSANWLREDLAACWHDEAELLDVARRGEVLKRKDGRLTLRFHAGERSFVLKYHPGVGWREILKNLLQLRLPVVDAGPEYRAARLLAAAGVPSVVVAGFGAHGRNPARRRSFVITEDLGPRTSLEALCAAWREAPPSPRARRLLLERVATLARAMHAAGIQHRDFYLCHLLLDECSLTRSRVAAEIDLRIIDLHRARHRVPLPWRWRAKDLAALAFSARDIGLTRADRLRFVREYAGGGLRAALGERALWRAVQRRTARLIARSR